VCIAGLGQTTHPQPVRRAPAGSPTAPKFVAANASALEIMPMPAKGGTEKPIVESGCARLIKRMIGLGVRAESSRAGRVCQAVGLRKSPKLRAEKLS